MFVQSLTGANQFSVKILRQIRGASREVYFDTRAASPDCEVIEDPRFRRAESGQQRIWPKF